jgi:tetratricopeptide (TPR) repeat protein
MMIKQRQRATSGREATALRAFLDAHDDDVAEIKQSLRTRTFISVDGHVVSKVIYYLNEASSHLTLFEDTLDLPTKTDFLKSLMRAWEIADATGSFNGNTLREYRRISDFSVSCMGEIKAFQRNTTIPAQEKGYWQEVARAGLIHIADLYRSQKMNQCLSQLDALLVFVEGFLKDERIRCDGILGQIFYFSSKANRFDGRLETAEDDLARAVGHYSARARRLVDKTKEIRQALNRQEDASLEGELQDAREKFGEVNLRLGVVEVTRAWLYFSQGNYRGAKHSAHTAMLLLSPSGDELTKYHARLVTAAVDRVTSNSSRALDETVSELTEIRKYFWDQRHSRLMARTEYELLLALILLDSTLENAYPAGIKNREPLKVVARLIRQRSPHVTDRWESLKLTLRSRFLRHSEMKREAHRRDFKDAIATAEKALEKATNTTNHDCQIEAMIACGEAYFEQGFVHSVGSQAGKTDNTSVKYPKTLAANDSLKRIESFASAKRILSVALDLCLNTNFPDLMAIVRLLLARIAVQADLYDEADYHLHEFRRIKISEHAWIRRLHDKVFSEYHRDDYLVLHEGQLTKDEAFRALQRFLIIKAQEKALRETGKVTEDAVAGNINITRVTLTKWREETGVNKPLKVSDVMSDR